MTPSRILLVDDDRALLQALPELLRLRMPWVAADTCDDAAAALERLSTTDYEVIVTDVKMPGIDGLALLREIRARRPETPTLLITGHGEHDLAVRALRGGAYDFVQKPVDRDYFVASLARAIRTRQLSREVERQRAALAHHAGQLERIVEARTRQLLEANAAKDRLLRREQEARAAAEAAQRSLAFLAEASARLAGSLDYRATLTSLAELVVPALADWCAVDVVEEGQSIRPLAAVHVDPALADLVRDARPGGPAAPGAPHGVRRVVETGRAELVPEVSDAMLEASARDEAHYRRLCRLGCASYMAVPLIARGRTLAVMTLATADSGRRYGPADLALAEEVARRAALAVDNARLYQEAQRAVRARDAFLARASHELRTPLTSALGTVRLLQRNLTDRPREDSAVLVDIACRNLGVMATLVDDLLDASKLGLGRETLTIEPVAVAELVHAGLEVVGEQAREKGVALQVAVPDELRVRADRIKLEQVLVNLLVNAIKFTPGGGTVAVEAKAEPDAVTIRVRDSGEGLAREHLESIFEPFVQASPAAASGRAGRRHPPRQRGSGLGLAICRQIVHLHGGAIWAESDGPGRGSTFSVRLPQSAAPGRETASSAVGF
ncbi:MAG TPA: ATP-binding protein [Thermodesulfobacteriota bacterium]